MRIRQLAFATLFSGASLFATAAQADVWPTTSNWSSSWESEYVSWVRSEWSINIFVQPTLNGQPNPFKGLRADCADTVYAMRAIFSYLHGLPFAMKDPSGGGGLLTNKMSRFDGQSGPQRARSFVALIFGVGSTKSLPNDTYPVEISARAIKPGGLILTTAKNHHSWSIQNISSAGIPRLVFNSTTGAASKSLLQQRDTWPTSPGWVFEGNQTPSGHAGIRAFRPLQYIGRPVYEVPGYSEEQYKIPLSKYTATVVSALRTQKESSDGRMRRLMNNVCEDFKGRINAVHEALVQQQMNKGRCMSAGEYDTYSTPSRDRRTYDEVVALRSAYQGASGLDAKTASQLARIFDGARGEPFCVQEYLPGKQMDVAGFAERVLNRKISNNPNETGEVRWGDRQGPSQRGASCPKY